MGEILNHKPQAPLHLEPVCQGLNDEALLVLVLQTEAERRRREAGVKQSMEIRLGSCMYAHGWVRGYVWYLELSREPRHVAQQTRYQNVGLRNGHCLGTVSSGCDF